MDTNLQFEAFVQKHDCDKAKTHLAFRVYLNLAEVRGWRDVNLHYCWELQAPFVTGKASLSADHQAALPISVEQSLSHRQMKDLFSLLRVDGQTFDRIMLAICASDTSIVYYKISNDVVKPEPPEVSDARKYEWQQRGAKRRRCVAECIETFRQEQDTEPP